MCRVVVFSHDRFRYRSWSKSIALYTDENVPGGQPCIQSTPRTLSELVHDVVLLETLDGTGESPDFLLQLGHPLWRVSTPPPRAVVARVHPPLHRAEHTARRWTSSHSCTVAPPPAGAQLPPWRSTSKSYMQHERRVATRVT